MATKRKQPSGAQNRKKRKEREAERDRGLVASGKGWLTQDTYRGTGDQYDPNKPPVQLPLWGASPATTVGALNAAILSLEQGAFYSAAILWDGMLRDDRITATLNVRLNGLLGSKLDLDPADENDQAQKVADECCKQISKIMPIHQLQNLMRYGIGLSVGLAQVLTKRELKSTTPTLRVWNPRFLRYDWLLRQYRLITQNRGEITIERGDPEWIIYEPYGPCGWMHGALIRCLVLPYLIRYWTRNWWSRYQEVHGQPIRAGIVPMDRKPADEKIFLTQLSDLAHEAVIRLPQGEEGNQFDVKLVEAQSKNWSGFEQLLEHADKSIDIALLGQSMSTEGVSGLGSQENAGESTLMRIIRGDSNVAEVLRDQLLKPYVAADYGDPELAPYLRWEYEPPEDEAKAAAVDLQVAQALVAFKAAGAPLDVREYMTMRNYPLLTEQQHQAEKQKAVEDAQAMMQATTPRDEPDGDEGEEEEDE